MAGRRKPPVAPTAPLADEALAQIVADVFTAAGAAAGSAKDRARAQAQAQTAAPPPVQATTPLPDLPALDAAPWLTTAKLVRSYVRANCLQPAIRRLWRTGMGLERFDVPTAFGGIVNVEASASVQVKALAEIVKIGVPQQIGLTDDDGHVLPGVFALGELELMEAQRAAHDGRLAAAAAVFGTPPPVSDVARLEATPPPELEYVEITEDAVTVRDTDAPPAPLPDIVPTDTPEARILAKRRAHHA